MELVHGYYGEKSLDEHLLNVHVNVPLMAGNPDTCNLHLFYSLNYLNAPAKFYSLLILFESNFSDKLLKGGQQCKNPTRKTYGTDKGILSLINIKINHKENK